MVFFIIFNGILLLDLWKMNNIWTWKIELFKSKNWSIEVQVDFNKEMVWLDVYKIANIFWKDRSTIQRHIKKIYERSELDKKSTCANFAQVQTEWDRKIKRNIEFYNLDMILSIWYIVNSKEAIQFRKWSTKILKNHLVQWYSINPKRLSETGIDEFEKAVALIKRMSFRVNLYCEKSFYKNNENERILCIYSF